MVMIIRIASICFFILFISCCLWQCNYSEQQPIEQSPEQTAVENSIRDIHQSYVQGWLASDEDKIMNLLEDNAMIQPNSMTPIVGKEEIRSFWFPDDGSHTWIRNYKTEIIDFQLLDTIAITTHTSYLDWDYKKDTLEFGRIQQGINTTVYRKQIDGQWKIWRSMWTDIASEVK